MPTDPICHMQVDESTPWTAEVDGQPVYFYSKHCREKFLADHEAQSHKPQNPCCHGHDHAPEEHVREGAVYTCPMHPEVKQGEPGNCPKCGMLCCTTCIEPLTIK